MKPEQHLEKEILTLKKQIDGHYENFLNKKAEWLMAQVEIFKNQETALSIEAILYAISNVAWYNGLDDLIKNGRHSNIQMVIFPFLMMSGAIRIFKSFG